MLKKLQLAFIKKIKIAAFWHHIDAHLKWNDSLIHQQKKWFTWKELSNVCPASEKKTRLWWICGYGMRKLYVFWTMRDYNSISSMSVSILNIMACLDRILRCFLPSVTSFLSIDLPFLFWLFRLPALFSVLCPRTLTLVLLKHIVCLDYII